MPFDWKGASHLLRKGEQPLTGGINRLSHQQIKHYNKNSIVSGTCGPDFHVASDSFKHLGYRRGLFQKGDARGPPGGVAPRGTLPSVEAAPTPACLEPWVRMIVK